MHIIIIEDEKILSEKLSKKLFRNWYTTSIFNWYKEFISSYKQKWDLYIIDISLIDWSWFDIITLLRDEKNISSPIIITSWYSDIEKKIYWLELWADDYLEKPFSSDELIARIKSLLRRSYKLVTNSNIKYKNIEYIYNTKYVQVNWVEVDLTAREIQLVEFLMFNIWKLISKSELLNSVWWENDLTKISDNTINVTISKIRKKIWYKFWLRTVKGKWYILKKI